MKLIDLNPQWIDVKNRKGLGITFKCMTNHCNGKVWILFHNPLDGGKTFSENCVALMLQQEAPDNDRSCGFLRWERTGDRFENLSLVPSINAHECGHFALINGEFK